MIPINQVILGGGDPLLGNSMVGNSLDEQLQLIEKYKQNLEAAKQLRQQVQPVQQPVPQRMIWDEIDAEISPMTDEQKIVESAIVFWFKDADCKAENKVVEYLGEY